MRETVYDIYTRIRENGGKRKREGKKEIKKKKKFARITGVNARFIKIWNENVNYYRSI